MPMDQLDFVLKGDWGFPCVHMPQGLYTMRFTHATVGRVETLMNSLVRADKELPRDISLAERWWWRRVLIHHAVMVACESGEKSIQQLAHFANEFPEPERFSFGALEILMPAWPGPANDKYSIRPREGQFTITDVSHFQRLVRGLMEIRDVDRVLEIFILGKEFPMTWSRLVFFRTVIDVFSEKSAIRKIQFLISKLRDLEVKAADGLFRVELQCLKISTSFEYPGELGWPPNANPLYKFHDVLIGLELKDIEGVKKANGFRHAIDRLLSEHRPRIHNVSEACNHLLWWPDKAGPGVRPGNLHFVIELIDAAWDLKSVIVWKREISEVIDQVRSASTACQYDIYRSMGKVLWSLIEKYKMHKMCAHIWGKLDQRERGKIAAIKVMLEEANSHGNLAVAQELREIIYRVEARE